LEGFFALWGFLWIACQQRLRDKEWKREKEFPLRGARRERRRNKKNKNLSRLSFLHLKLVDGLIRLLLSSARNKPAEGGKSSFFSF
jgi:hypothetical protein